MQEELKLTIRIFCLLILPIKLFLMPSSYMDHCTSRIQGEKKGHSFFFINVSLRNKAIKIQRKKKM